MQYARLQTGIVAEIELIKPSSFVGVSVSHLENRGGLSEFRFRGTEKLVFEHNDIVGHICDTFEEALDIPRPAPIISSYTPTNLNPLTAYMRYSLVKAMNDMPIGLNVVYKSQSDEFVTGKYYPECNIVMHDELCTRVYKPTDKVSVYDYTKGRFATIQYGTLRERYGLE